MTPEELRLECLKLVQQTANASGLLLEPGQIIARARAYADFVAGSGGPNATERVKPLPNLEIMPEELSRHEPVVSAFKSGAPAGARGA